MFPWLIRNQPTGPNSGTEGSSGVNLLKVLETTSGPWRQTENQDTYRRPINLDNSLMGHTTRSKDKDPPAACTWEQGH